MTPKQYEMRVEFGDEPYIGDFRDWGATVVESFPNGIETRLRHSLLTITSYTRAVGPVVFNEETVCELLAKAFSAGVAAGELCAKRRHAQRML